MKRLRLAAGLAAGIVALTLTGCGGDEPTDKPNGTLAVVASFYPLQFVAQRVGGDAVSVANLTKPGGEPHDLELAPADVAGLARADLVVYQAGFQPAVDDAVKQEVDAAKAIDVVPAAKLEPVGEPVLGKGDHAEDRDSLDPHFWLDPTRLADVGDAVATRLAEIDPARASSYSANADELRADLDELDGHVAGILSSCRSRELVTAHDAFGYLARRYELTEVAIAGLSPDVEPSAQHLAEVAKYVKDYDVGTIFYETLVSPEVAETVAAETGAKTAVLDPIEGITDTSAGKDYLAVMTANLDALEKGLRCD